MQQHKHTTGVSLQPPFCLQQLDTKPVEFRLHGIVSVVQIYSKRLCKCSSLNTTTGHAVDLISRLTLKMIYVSASVRKCTLIYACAACVLAFTGIAWLVMILPALLTCSSACHHRSWVACLYFLAPPHRIHLGSCVVRQGEERTVGQGK